MKTMKYAASGRKRAGRFLPAVLLAVLLLCSTCMPALAASSESIDPDKTGSITLTIQDAVSGTAATDGEVAIYRVADLDDAKSSWVCSDEFLGLGETFTDLESAQLAQSLADYAEENEIAVTNVAVVKNGEVAFDDLAVGGYLVVQTKESTGFYTISPFIVTLPMEDGQSWIYDVDATPKAQIGMIGEESPQSDGENPETVNPETVNPGSETAGSETAESEASGSDADAASPSTTPEPSAEAVSTLPQTGQLNWPIPVLAAAGVLLIVAGSILRRRKTYAS